MSNNTIVNCWQNKNEKRKKIIFYCEILSLSTSTLMVKHKYDGNEI